MGLVSFSLEFNDDAVTGRIPIIRAPSQLVTGVLRCIHRNLKDCTVHRNLKDCTVYARGVPVPTGACIAAGTCIRLRLCTPICVR